MKNGSKTKKTKIVKENLKVFNDAIKNFNARLKTAVKKNNISDKSFRTLIIDKDKKDFYRRNLMNKRQFNKFINELNKGNDKTLKKVKRGRLSDLDITRYEQQLYLKNTKYSNEIKEVYDLNMDDVIMNVTDTDFSRIYNRLLTVHIIKENRPKKYLENFKKAYQKRFGAENELLDTMTIQDIEKLMKYNPQFSIQFVYDKRQDRGELKKSVDEMLKEMVENKVMDKLEEMGIKVDNPEYKDAIQEMRETYTSQYNKFLKSKKERDKVVRNLKKHKSYSRYKIKYKK